MSKILKLSLCGAIVLVGAGFALGGAIDLPKRVDEQNALLEKYDYTLNNAKMKNEKILKLTEQFNANEISDRMLSHEIKQVERQDFDRTEYMKIHATQEDVKTYESAEDRKVSDTFSFSFGSGAAFIGGVVGLVELGDKKREL